MRVDLISARLPQLLQRCLSYSVLVASVLGLYTSICSADGNGVSEISHENSMKINFIFNDQTVTATLNDNATAQDFAALLPLTLELDDYANTEKIAYLPRKLTQEGTPKGTVSAVGDLSYYAPWGNMVVFYKPFGYADGLINIGKIDGDLRRFVNGKPLTVTIEIAKD